MRPRLAGVLLLLFWVCTFGCMAQDVILRLDGTTNKGKVLALPGDQIKFLPEGAAPKKYIFIPTKTVQEILYENGKKIYFNTSISTSKPDSVNVNSKKSKPGKTEKEAVLSTNYGQKKEKKLSNPDSSDKGSTITNRKPIAKDDQGNVISVSEPKTENDEPSTASGAIYDDEEDYYPRTAFKINLAPLPFGSLAVFGEQYLANGISFVAGFNKVTFGNYGPYLNQVWWSATPELRFYLNKEHTLNGTYIAPYAKFWSVLRSDSIHGQKGPKQFQLSFFGVGSTFGRQFVIQDRLLVDIFVGITIYVNQNLPNNLTIIQKNDFSSQYNRDFRLGLVIGFGL